MQDRKMKDRAAIMLEMLLPYCACHVAYYATSCFLVVSQIDFTLIFSMDFIAMQERLYRYSNNYVVLDILTFNTLRLFMSGRRAVCI